MNIKSYYAFVLFLLVSFNNSIAQDEWMVKSGDEEIRFKIKNMGFWVKGSFTGLQATIRFNPNNLSQAYMEAHLGAASVNTGMGARDKHLREADFFDVAQYPFIVFTSKKISSSGKGYQMEGEIFLDVKTQPLSFGFVFAGDAHRGVLRASFEVDRTAFGIGSSSGSMGKMVKVEVSVPVLN